MTDTRRMHTPGPWRLEHSSMTGQYVVRMGKAAIVVSDNADSAANARLIAAAPELLEALRSISAIAFHLGWNEGNRPDLSNEDRWRIVNIYRTALAKVNGEHA